MLEMNQKRRSLEIFSESTYKFSIDFFPEMQNSDWDIRYNFTWIICLFSSWLNKWTGCNNAGPYKTVTIYILQIIFFSINECLIDIFTVFDAYTWVPVF